MDRINGTRKRFDCRITHFKHLICFRKVDNDRVLSKGRLKKNEIVYKIIGRLATV